MNNPLITFLMVIVSILILIKLLPSIFNYYKKIKIKSIYKKANIRDIDKMRGLEFETYLSALFSELGYKTIITNASHDFGADLILKRGNHKIVVQAKRYAYKKHVSIGAIQEVFTAQRYHNADECWVVTNSFFTKSAIKLAKPCNVILKDRNSLSKWILQINSNVKPTNIKRNKISNRKCPKCNSNLVIRKSKQNKEFIGCKNYPKCKYTENI